MNTMNAAAKLTHPKRATRTVRLINEKTGERRRVEVTGTSSHERNMSAVREAGTGWRIDTATPTNPPTREPLT